MTQLLRKVTIFIVFFIILAPNFLAYGQEQKESTLQVSALPETVDVYALFWPIVPGKTVKDPMFWVKQLKESLGGFLSFGDINKAKYEITLSEKRMVEANKLFLEDEDFSNAQKTLDMNTANRKKAMGYLKKAHEANRNTGDLRVKMVTSLQNQELVLNNLLSKLPDNQKGKIEKILGDLSLQISESR